MKYSRKALLNETDLSRRYRGKEEEMQLKKGEVDRLIDEFETKLRKKEGERIALQKELGELAIALCAEALKKKQQEEAVSTTVKDDQVHKLREELNLRRRLEVETEDFAKKAEKMESMKRKQESEARSKKDQLAGREKREQDLDKRDLAKKHEDNHSQQKKIEDERHETRVRFKEGVVEQRLKISENRKLKDLTSGVAEKRRMKEEQEREALENFKRRDLDAKFHEHDDNVNHVLRLVSKDEMVEKDLLADVQNAERACQKEEGELAKIAALLQDVHKQNAHHIRSEMIKCSQEEDELENHFHQIRASMKTAQTQREELLLGLKRHREQTRMDKDKLSSLEKEQARLLKLGSRPQQEVRKPPKPYIQHYPGGLP